MTCPLVGADVECGVVRFCLVLCGLVLVWFWGVTITPRRLQVCDKRCPGGVIKYTLPGPMTILGSTAQRYRRGEQDDASEQDDGYANEKELAFALARVVNEQVLSLVKAGCRAIQIDEPLFARKPDEALDYGIECLSVCFADCPSTVDRQMHMCCGYPGYVDQVDYPKANSGAYLRLASRLDECDNLDAISIEDAWCRNDLATLLPLIKKKKIILGVVNVAGSRVETVEEIRARLGEALRWIDSDRLVVAPDCGLALLDGEHRSLVGQKLANMCEAAKEVPIGA